MSHTRSHMRAPFNAKTPTLYHLHTPTQGETSAPHDVTSNIERSKHLDDAQQAKIYKAEVGLSLNCFEGRIQWLILRRKYPWKRERDRAQRGEGGREML